MNSIKKWVWYFVPHEHNFVFSRSGLELYEALPPFDPLWLRYDYEISICTKCGKEDKKTTGCKEVQGI